MTPDFEQDRPVHNDLHPRVYLATVSLAAWLVMSVWTFFSGSSYSSLIFVVVTAFFIIAIGIPVMLWRTWERNHRPDRTESAHPTFRDWRRGVFDTRTGQRKASDAAAEILLPLAAVAFGMTIFGLVFYFASGGAA